MGRRLPDWAVNLLIVAAIAGALAAWAWFFPVHSVGP